MSVLRGTVTQLAPDGRPLVEVPDLAPGYAFGPLDVAVAVPLVAGDRVVVSPVGGNHDDLVVTGVMNAQDRAGGGAGGGAAFKVTTEEFIAETAGPQTLVLEHPLQQVFLVTWASVPQPSSEFGVDETSVTLLDPLGLILVGDRITVTYAHPPPPPVD